MIKRSKKFILSREVYKYPYSGKSDFNKNYLSDKIVTNVITLSKKTQNDIVYLRRKTQRKLNWLIFVIDVFFHLATAGLVPPVTSRSISVPFGWPPLQSHNPPIIRSLNSNVGLPKDVLLAQIVKDSSEAQQFSGAELDQLYELSIQFSNDSISKAELINRISNLRGGDLGHVVGALGIIAAIIMTLTNSWTIIPNTFRNRNPMPTPYPRWSNQPGPGHVDIRPSGSSGPASKPSTAREMEKPSEMPQPVYSALSKAEKRQLADPLGRDGAIDIDGYPRLDVRYNQVSYKTPKHGRDHNLPIDEKGKTPKTEANALALRDSLLDMPNRESIVWFTDGQYQGGTPAGCDCVNLYDTETNLIAVYVKRPDGNLFLTTCTLTEEEADHLKATNGNFVTEKMLRDKTAVSEDVIVPPPPTISPGMNPMKENSSPNDGFPLLNISENDVPGMPPSDNSE